MSFMPEEYKRIAPPFCDLIIPRPEKTGPGGTGDTPIFGPYPKLANSGAFYCDFSYPVILSGDFKLDCWVYINTYSGYRNLWVGNGAYNTEVSYGNSKLKVQFSDGGYILIPVTNYSLTRDIQRRAARITVERVAGLFSVYADGVKVSNDTVIDNRTLELTQLCGKRSGTVDKSHESVIGDASIWHNGKLLHHWPNNIHMAEDQPDVASDNHLMLYPRNVYNQHATWWWTV